MNARSELSIKFTFCLLMLQQTVFGLAVLLLWHLSINALSILVPPQRMHKKIYKACLKSDLKNKSLQS